MTIGKPTYGEGPGVWVSPNDWYLITDENGDGTADSIVVAPTEYAKGHWKTYEPYALGANTEEIARRLFGDAWKDELSFWTINPDIFSEIRSPQMVASAKNDLLIAGLEEFNLGCGSGLLGIIGIAALSETALGIVATLGIVSLIDRGINLFTGISNDSFSAEAIAREIGAVLGGIVGSVAGFGIASGAGLSIPRFISAEKPVLADTNPADVIDLDSFRPFGGPQYGHYGSDVIVHGATLVKVAPETRPALTLVRNILEEPDVLPETNPEILIPLFDPEPPPEIVRPPAEPHPEIIIPFEITPPSWEILTSGEDDESEAAEEEPPVEFEQTEGPIVTPLYELPDAEYDIDIDTQPVPDIENEPDPFGPPIITASADNDDGASSPPAPDAAPAPQIQLEPIPSFVEPASPDKPPSHDVEELREMLNDEIFKEENDQDTTLIQAIVKRLYDLGDKKYLLNHDDDKVVAIVHYHETGALIRQITAAIEAEAPGLRRGDLLVKLIDALLTLSHDFGDVLEAVSPFGMGELAKGLMAMRTPEKVKQELKQAIKTGNIVLMQRLVLQLIDHGEYDYLRTHRDSIVRGFYASEMELESRDTQSRALNLKAALEIAMLRDDDEGVRDIADKLEEAGEIDFLRKHSNPKIQALALRMAEDDQTADELDEDKELVRYMAAMGIYLLKYEKGAPQYNEDFEQAVIKIYEAGQASFLASLPKEAIHHVERIVNRHENRLAVMEGKVRQVKAALQEQNFGLALKLIEEVSKERGGWEALREIDNREATGLLFQIFGNQRMSAPRTGKKD